MTSTHIRRRTERLDLRAVSMDDLDPLYELHADPEGWHHFPQGRHTDVATTREFVERVMRGWEVDGLSYWTVREAGGGAVIGLGGVRRLPDDTWNLAYRFARQVQGRGFAQEVSRAALAAAAVVDPSMPVVAWIDDPNPASVRVAERVGLAYRGRRRNVDGDLLRVYADRPLPAGPTEST